MFHPSLFLVKKGDKYLLIEGNSNNLTDKFTVTPLPQDTFQQPVWLGTDPLQA
jgi:hypothetical protein